MDPRHITSAGFWVSLWNAYGRDVAFQVLTAAARIAAIVVAYLVVRFLLFKLIDRIWLGSLGRLSGDILSARRATVRALQSLLKSVIGFVMGFVAAMMILQAAGIRVESLLVTTGVAGIAAGFGAQKLVRDTISGFLVLAEDQYGVGDYVTIGAVTGTVEDLGMRSTRIRDSLGRLHIIANGDIAAVCNHSRGQLLLNIDVAVPSDTDLEKAAAVLNELGRQIAADMPEQVRSAFECEGMSQVSGSAVSLRFVGAVAPRRQDEVRMALNARVRAAFEQNGLRLA